MEQFFEIYFWWMLFRQKMWSGLSTRRLIHSFLFIYIYVITQHCTIVLDTAGDLIKVVKTRHKEVQANHMTH